MRLAIVNFTSGGLSGGYRSYLRHILPAIAAQPEVSALRVLIPPAPDMISGPELDVRSWPETGARASAAWIRRDLQSFRPDVVFVPSARAFRLAGVPTVVMVRNMEPLLCPLRGNTLAEGLRNIGRREVAKYACRHADRIIAVSAFVQDFLVGQWQLDPQKIGVVHHGVAQDPPADAVQAPTALGASAPERWLFTAGSIRPARGLDDAIGALQILRAGGRPVRLAIAGEPDAATRDYAAKLRRSAIRLGLGDDILWLGRIKGPEMGWCFRQASAFIMTSRAEACPNTVLEGMAQGAVCISTDLAPMPEFLDGVASYYHAENASALAQCILDVFALTTVDRDLRRAAARHRARSFTWERAAIETVAQLQTALA